MLKPDILIIGSGPGGATAAWALAHAGRDVLMIDRADFPRDKTCGDGLTPLAASTLRHMGILDLIEAANPAHIDRVRIVGPFGAEMQANFADFMEPDLSRALVLPRYRFDEILRQHAIRAGVQFRGSLRVEQVTLEGDTITAAHCNGPEGPVEIHPKQVLFAVGANMGLLERAGLMRGKARLMRAARAYYTDVHTPPDRYDFFFDLALLPGYGWIFPTGDGRANIGAGTLPVFWSSKKTAQTLMAGFVERRKKEGIMPHAQQDGPVKGFPLRIDFPGERVAGENWIIVGEATGLVNPITGEGIDLAMVSGLIGAETLDADLTRGRRNHIAYQRELWQRFGPMFTGLRFLREILVTPLLLDYVIWLTTQHRFLFRTVMRINQGATPPQDVLHPLFIIQFFTPISPLWVARQMQRMFQQKGHSQAHP